MSRATVLREPLQIGTMGVAGRLFKAATSETRATEDGFVTNELLDFYEPMARAGTPLIVTGNLHVSLQGRSAGCQAGIEDDDKLPGLREWVDVAHRHAVKLIAQLNHGGRQMLKPAPGSSGIVAPSAVREPINGVRPRALRRDELPGIVETFAAAAVRAQEAGFDGVQIHAAHGYLLSQFLTPHTNRRDDDYGGSLTNRARLLLEVLAAGRERVGDDFPVLAKLNGTDMLPLRRAATTDELVAVGVALQDGGLDALDIPVICVGGFHSRVAMEGAIRAGGCDAVSAARAFVADPYLFRTVTGDPVHDGPVCGYCNGCIARFGGQPVDCYSPPIRARKDAMLRRPIPVASEAVDA